MSAGTVGNLVNFGNAQKLLQFSRTGFARKVVGGFFARPLFGDVSKTAIENLNKKPDDKSNLFSSSLKAVKDHFAVGDLVSILGVGLFICHHFIESKVGGEEAKGSFLGKALLWGAGILSAGGLLLARAGQALGLHKEFAFGDEYIDLLIKEGEKKTGKQIFPKLVNDDLVKDSDKASQTLVYSHDVAHRIKQRHLKDKVGGFFSGPFGTGKTEGVKLVLGNWIKKMKEAEKEVEIHKLDLGNFSEALEKLNAEQLLNKEDLSTMGLSEMYNSSMEANQTLMAFEYLIKRCKEAVGKAKENGVASAIFIDEFEKVFDLSKLKGCDSQKINRAFVQLNSLIQDDYGNILITSNKSRADLQKELKDIVDPKVLGAFLDRLDEVYVDLPGPLEQSEIIANYIFGQVETSNLKIEDFSFGDQLTINNRNDLAALIFNHSVKSGNYLSNKVLNGRKLEKIIEGLPGYLIELKTKDKDSKISLEQIKFLVENGVTNANKLTGENHDTVRVKKAYELVQKYVEKNKAAILTEYNAKKDTKISTLDLFKVIYDHKPDNIYDSKDGSHSIRFENDKVRINYKNEASLGTDTNSVFWAVDGTNFIDAKEFESMVAVEVANILPKTISSMGFIESLAKLFQNTITNEDFLRSLGTIAAAIQ